MFRAEVTVTLRPGILDVQGKTVQNSLHALGYADVSGVRMGKFITFDVDAPDAVRAEAIARDVSERLLSNPVIESFDVAIRDLQEVA